MLYITTWNQNDVYTAHRALTTDHSPDGGLFVPFHLPTFDNADIDALKDKSSGQIIADVLNLFFSCRLTGWDVDFCIGKNPIKVKSMNHKLMIAEIWHNHAAKYEFIKKALFSKICSVGSNMDCPTDWFCIAMQVAVLFAIFAEILRHNIFDFSQPVDIAVSCDDFTAPMSAWYARKMGLPIGTIICSCEDNSAVWDLIHRGQINTGNVNQPEGLERLIHDVFGCDEVREYKHACKNRSTYSLDEERLKLLNNSIFAAVIGKDRIPAVINSMSRTNDYIIDEKTAVVYAGLQDFRTRVSTGYNGLLLAYDYPDHVSGRI